MATVETLPAGVLFVVLLASRLVTYL
jgi:hypothetical protein